MFITLRQNNRTGYNIIQLGRTILTLQVCIENIAVPYVGSVQQSGCLHKNKNNK